jgi:glycosyltransferase involved in cell wall biosynthesis
MGRAQPSVVFFNDVVGWGGTEQYLYVLARGLSRRGITVRLVVPSPGPAPGDRDAFVARFRDEGIAVHVVRRPRTNLGRGPWAYRLFRRMRRSHGREQIFHFNQTVPGAHLVEIVCARLARIRLVVVTNHLPVLDRSPGLLRRGLAWVAKRSTDLVIVESETNRQMAVEKGFADADSTIVVLHGIDLRALDHAAAQPIPRDELGVGSAEFVIGSVGRLAPQKGFAYLIQALSTIRSKHRIDAALVIAGTGAQHEELTRLIERLGLDGHVRLLGHRGDVTRLLPAFDVFALSSEFEGLPLAILEAMAAGRPVVATDVGGVRDAVADTETGFLVPPRDSDAIAEALVRLARDRGLREEMGSRAAAIASVWFDQERMVTETWNAYGKARRGKKLPASTTSR